MSHRYDPFEQLGLRKSLGAKGRRLLRFEQLEDRSVMNFDLTALPGAPPVMIDALNPHDFETIGNITYFSGRTPAHSEALWRTDGTAAGTWMVKDPQVGFEYETASYCGYESLRLRGLSESNGDLLFMYGQTLWRSDGTAQGTRMLREFNGNVSTVDLNGRLLLIVTSGTDAGLWSAGVAAFGPVKISEVEYKGSFAIAGSTAYFWGRTAQFGTELWKTDGTAEGTSLVADLTLPAYDSSFSFYDRPLAVSGSFVYFAFNTTEAGRELWRSNGTAAGTTMLKDIEPGNVGSDPFEMTDVNGTLYFVANNSMSGQELWKSNGTSAGTVMVKDIEPGTGFSYPRHLTELNGTLFFAATESIHGRELWKSNGTSAGTVLVKEVRPGPDHGYLDNFNAAGSKLFFTANDGTTGTELHVSNGTSAGTHLVSDSAAGTADSPFGYAPGYSFVSFVTFGSLLMYRNGSDLWRSDGTATGTYLLTKNVEAYFELSEASGGKAYFGGEDRLFRTDGTVAGTAAVTKVNLYAANSSSRHLFVIDETVYYVSVTASGKSELWSVTESGTPRRVNADFVPSGEVLYYVSNVDGIIVVKTYRSLPSGLVYSIYMFDPTSSMLSLFLPELEFYHVDSKFNRFKNNAIVFEAYKNNTSRELWRTDFTAAGTYPLLSEADSTSRVYSNFAELNGETYFLRSDPNTVRLYKTAL